MTRIRRITIITEIKDKDDLNAELQEFSNALGLFSDRDKEKSCFRIFITLLKARKNNDMLSSDEIASESHLTRGAVIHHINRLIDSGLIVEKRNRYGLGVDDLENLIDYLEEDIDDFFKALKERARKLDKELGL